MEYYWNSSSSNATTTVRGHNCNFTTNPAWDSSWDLATPTTAARPDWNYYSPPQQPAAATRKPEAAFPAQHQDKNCTSAAITSSSPPPLYYNPDPHLTCLKLGKRHYFGELTPPPALISAGMGPTKKGKAACVESVSEEALATTAVVPKCQVVGCEAALANAKDYHRRHKVCEMHAKAPKVVLLGIDQRFCQQCSRFHALAEFDEAKRSCRRRLAGHNERRRKSSQEHNSLAKKHFHEIKMMGGGRNPQPHPQFLNNGECALSLLSPTTFAPWCVPPSPDLPARCSAALRELIAENRASVYACRQLINCSQVGSCWASAAAPENRDNVTLNLMQGPGSCFGLIPGHSRRSSGDDGDGDCSDSDLWKLPLGY